MYLTNTGTMDNIIKLCNHITEEQRLEILNYVEFFIYTNENHRKFRIRQDGVIELNNQ